ncbi:MAG: hypothetical protein HUU35_04995 [Armatimonadetes bacterium]|nr:hypothetical protein [Armatimonadota bacterium]
MEWREALLLQVAASPGMTEAQVLRTVGTPDETLDSRFTTIAAICAGGSYRPVPRVEGWRRVLVYREFMFLQMVFLDEHGVVICTTTSLT